MASASAASSPTLQLFGRTRMTNSSTGRGDDIAHARFVCKRVGIVPEMDVGHLRLCDEMSASVNEIVLTMKRFLFHPIPVIFDLCAWAIVSSRC